MKEGGTVYVLLPADTPRDAERDTDDTPGGIPHPSSASDALISEMRSHLADLRAQLQAERQAHAEGRRLLAAALERIPPQLEPPEQETAPEPRESPETATPQPGRVEPQTTIEAAGETERAGRATSHESAMGGGSLRRSWWRRMFGGGS